MDNSAELAGRLLPSFLFACLALYFLIKAFSACERSRRLANIALFCGLTVLVQPETALGISPGDYIAAFVLLGCLRILLGIAGIALVVAAFFARHDGGVGFGRLFTAGGFSLLHVMFGGGLLMFSSFSFPATPWRYQSPDGISLSLPSRQWKYAPAAGDPRPAFVCGRPHMQAIVQSVSRQQTEAEFRQFAAEARDKMEELARDRSAAKFLEGVNAAGNSYSYCTGIEQAADGKTIFVAHCVIWCPSREMVVSVLFEGVPRMLSQAGKAAEMSAFNAAAEKICLSVQ